jgi:hypothetical protein
VSSGALGGRLVIGLEDGLTLVERSGWCVDDVDDDGGVCGGLGWMCRVGRCVWRSGVVEMRREPFPPRLLRARCTVGDRSLLIVGSGLPGMV